MIHHQSSGAKVWTRFSSFCKRIYYIHVLTYALLIDQSTEPRKLAIITVFRYFSIVIYFLFIALSPLTGLFLLLPVKIFFLKKKRTLFTKDPFEKKGEKRSLYPLDGTRSAANCNFNAVTKVLARSSIIARIETILIL